MPPFANATLVDRRLLEPSPLAVERPVKAGRAGYAVVDTGPFTARTLAAKAAAKRRMHQRRSPYGYYRGEHRMPFEQYYPPAAQMSPTAGSGHNYTPMSPCRRTARNILIEQLCKPSMRQLSSRYPLRCPYCGMTFIHQIHLTAHVRLHRPQSDVKCPECSVMCVDDLSLQDHLEKVHAPERAFSVSYSIAERISYGQPESPPGKGQLTVMSPCSMSPVPEEPVPEDFAYLSAFGRHHKRRRSYTSSSSGASSPHPSPAKRSKLVETLVAGKATPHQRQPPTRTMSILEQLLTRSDPTRPALPSDTPSIVIAHSQQRRQHRQHDHGGRPLSRPVSMTLAGSPKTERGTPISSAESSPDSPLSHSAEYCSNDSGSEHPSQASSSLLQQQPMEKDVACEHCGKRFLYKCNLARHLSAIHNERTLKIDSGSAGKSPRSPFKVGPSAAEAIPTEKKELVLLRCDFCERTFTQRSSLVLHQQVHQGPEPYRCSICHGVRFSTRAQMDGHMARHRVRAEQREQQLERHHRAAIVGGRHHQPHQYRGHAVPFSSGGSSDEMPSSAVGSRSSSRACSPAPTAVPNSPTSVAFDNDAAQSNTDDSDDGKLIIVDSDHEQ